MVAEARAVVGDLDLVHLDRAVQDVACDIGDPLLRTLDALHLASALLLGEALKPLKRGGTAPPRRGARKRLPCPVRRTQQ